MQLSLARAHEVKVSATREQPRAPPTLADTYIGHTLTQSSWLYHQYQRSALVCVVMTGPCFIT
jgi:hypothetical protein